MTRRIFIEGLGAFSVASFAGCVTSARETPVVRFGAVTDIHYADHDPDPQPLGVIGQRFYRESCRKLKEAVAVFNERNLDFAIELGDFKDLSADKASTIAHLEEIERSFAAFKGPRYHVFGNHDFDCLAPEEVGARLLNGMKPMVCGYYSFHVKGITFVVLDACYDSRLRHYANNNPWDDANIPPEEMAWLKGELTAASGPVVILAHQRLDDSADPRHLVRNAAEVRAVLEESGKVKSVITGHQHMGGYAVQNGITYYSLKALVCGSGAKANSFAEIGVYQDGSFSVTGWGGAGTAA